MLITIDQEVLNQLVKQVEKDRLSILAPHFVLEILEAIKHPRGESLDRGLKTLTPEIIKEVISYIEKGEFEESPEWSKKLTAHQYAENLFNKALEQRNTEECYSCLQQFSKLFEDEGWISYLEDPNIRISDKNKVLKLAGDNRLVLNLVYKLLDKYETGLVPDIIDEYRKILKGRSVIRAEVTTAIPIDKKYERKIIKYLDKMFGRKVFPTIFFTDPKILGGIVIRVGDKVLDHSVRGKLVLLKKEMIKAL